MALATRRRRRSFLGPIGTLVLIVVLGLLAWPQLTGREIPWLDNVVRAMGRGDRDVPDGLVAVPASGRAIAPYRSVRREDVWNAAENTLQVVYLSQETIDDRGILTSLGDIIGRVLAREKSSGYVFTEKDFLPEGVRPGITAGIPPGKRGYRIDPDQVSGLAGLERGDHFDLVATLPLDMRAVAGQEQTLGARVTGVWAERYRQRADMLSLLPRANVRVIVQDAVVVAPLTTRQVPYTANTLTQGQVQRNKIVNEMVVAVAPDEVATLSEQLAIEAQISCFPRSSHPAEPDDSTTPGLDADWTESLRSGFGGPGAGVWGGPDSPELRLVERMSGSVRSLSTVPVAGEN